MQHPRQDLWHKQVFRCPTTAAAATTAVTTTAATSSVSATTVKDEATFWTM